MKTTNKILFLFLLSISLIILFCNACAENTPDFIVPLPYPTISPHLENKTTPIAFLSAPANNFITSQLSNKPSPSILRVKILETPTSDTLLNVIAIGISFFAFLLSAYSLFSSSKFSKETIILQKQQNIDSVRPMLAIHLDANNFSISITNHGLGPAILKSMEWTDTSTDETYNTFCKLFYSKIQSSSKGLGVVYIPHVYTKPFVDDKNDPDVLAPNESLVFFQEKDIPLLKQKTLYPFMSGVIVKIEYTDLFRSETWTIKKDISWFAQQV